MVRMPCRDPYAKPYTDDELEDFFRGAMARDGAFMCDGSRLAATIREIERGARDNALKDVQLAVGRMRG